MNEPVPVPAQRLDSWLWCARVARTRPDCARLIAERTIRINAQPTDKPHAKVRVGDVLTLPRQGDIAVMRILALAARRGPATTARTLYEVI